MVRGLDVFRRHFAAHTHQYVLIGGTAATLAMEEAGLEFRATKDLDVVLHVEALDPDFGRVFWEFVEQGQYEDRQTSQCARPVFYRFARPRQPDFPFMLELFCRVPDGFQLPDGSRLTPIPFDEAVASLSAILLDDDYYAFVMDGRRDLNSLPWVGEDRLTPLKASARLDLTARRDAGDPVDSKDIRKHANDVLRLSQLLAPNVRIQLRPRITEDLERFITSIVNDQTLDPKALKISASLDEVLDQISSAYDLRPR